jgi:hypothetical protein
MQPNGGFFGSMMPQGASSFMPQGANPASMVAGIDGTPNALTSPPMGANLMAALQKLATLGQGMGQQGGSGQPSALPPNSTSPFMPGGGAPPGQPGQQPGQQQSPLAGLDPNMLKAILAKMGIGGAGAAAPGMG